MDRKAFFGALRRDLFPRGLTIGQANRIDTLLDAFDGAGWPRAYAAYGLATAHHETGFWQHMQELGGEVYFKRMYDKEGSRPGVAARLGNVNPGDGARFHGRGYVQLTGRANYAKAGAAIGLDLLADPEQAAAPPIAARILVWGMTTGAYTGKACRDYLSQSPPDYRGARRIINGTDKAGEIAGYAATFEAALRAAGYGDRSAPARTAAALPPLTPPPPTAAPVGFWARFWAALTRRLAA